MLLGYREILDLIRSGCIRNADESRVNAASLDLHLGERFLVPGSTNGSPVSLRRPTAMVETFGSVVLPPLGFCLACTKEVFYLPNDIAAEVKLRSSAARMGLNHALAGWCDPGWHGSVLTLEFFNCLSDRPIELKAGDRVVQMVFFRLAEHVPDHASYAKRGRYNGDTSTTGAKTDKAH